MKGRISWLLYGAFALVWLGVFGWRAHTTASRNTQLAQAQAATNQQAAQRRANATRPANGAERVAARRCIISQLEAFKKDDYVTAIKYQSSSLKRNFGSAANFRSIIQRQYPQFAHYKSAAFGSSICDKDGSHLNVAVTLIGADGKPINAVYALARESGTYHVDGVSVQPVNQPNEGNTTPPIDDAPVMRA